MRVLFALCALAAVAFAHEVEEGVIVGTDDNLKDIIADNEFVLVEFYAPWCGHCKSLAPEYAAAAQKLAEAGSDVKLVKVDATENTATASEYEVQGYPTLKWFRNGVATDYSGGRTESEIVQWINKKSGPPAISVGSVDDASNLKESNDVVAFGFFANAESEEAKSFLEAAVADESATYAIVFSDDDGADAVFTEFGVSAPAVVLKRQFDEPTLNFEGDFDATSIAAFVKGNSLPTVIEFSDENAPKIFGGELKSHMLLFADKKADYFAATLEAFTATAKANKGLALFILLDTGKEDNARISEFFGIEDGDTPTYRIINVDGEMSKYAPESNDCSEEALSQFVQDYSEGKLKKHLKSEETPADWDAQPVKVLTGGNFADVALSADAGVFVEFYAPWCGHCKQLAPIWDQLGEAVADYDDVVIAKCDSTANEFEDISIESFPTLKFFPKGVTDASQAVDFDGDRTLAGLTKFLAEKTGHPISGGSDDDDDEDSHDEL